MADDFFGYEIALRISAVCQLKALHDVTNGINAGYGRFQALVSRNEATIQGDAGFFVTKTSGCGATTDCDEENVSLEALAVFQLHSYTGICLFDALEPHAGLDRKSTR